MSEHSLHLLKLIAPGTYVASSGNAFSFSLPDLRQAAAAFSVSTGWRAPLVLGHPPNDRTAPEYGRVTGLMCRDEGLFAAVSVSPVLIDLVRRGFYKKLSAAFCSPHQPGNPAPGSWMLRHIGMLGAVAPAVTGLPEVEFACSESVAGSVEFAAPLCFGGDAASVIETASRFVDACPSLSLLEAVHLVGVQ